MGLRLNRLRLYRNAWSRWTSLPAAVAAGWARLVHPSPGPATGWRRLLIPRSVTLHPPRLRGAGLRFDPGDSDLAWIVEEFLQGSYDTGLVPWTPDLILDAGAHIGGFSVLAAAVWPGVPLEAFEPQPRHQAWYRSQPNLGSARLHAAAVGLRDGEAVFDTAHCGSVANGATEGDGHIRVSILDFPALVRARGPRRLVLKLDVEGAERELLPALQPVFPAQCAIFFETHGGEAAWDAARDLLERHAFAVRRLRTSYGCVDGFALR